MHIPDSANIVGGRYVLGPPRSVIGRHILNALTYELKGVMDGAGVAVRASGAADEAANYTGQLLQAIRRLVNHDQAFELVMDAQDDILALPRDQHFFRLTDAANGPYVDGTVALDANDPNDIGRRVWILNDSVSRKYIITGEFTVCIPPAGMAGFMSHDLDGDTRWAPIDSRQDTEAQFSGIMYESGNSSNQSPEFDMVFHEDFRTKVTHVRFPASVTLPTSATGTYSVIVVSQPDLSGLPERICPLTENRVIPIILVNDAGAELGYMQYTAQQWTIRKADGTDFVSASTVQVFFPELSFVNRS